MGMMSRVEREYLQEYNRRRYLPMQLEATRLKLRALEAEARRYGMWDLLPPSETLSRAWDREVMLAYGESA